MARTSLRTKPAQSPARDIAEDVGKPSSSDRVVAAIIKGILTGRYVPGQKLIEADLTQTLGMSRGPVREALKRLDAQGVVELTPHRGAYICAMRREEAGDLLVILEDLTALMVRLAAQAVSRGADAEEMSEAYQWLEKFRDGSAGDIAFIEKRRHFYDTLMVIGGNRQLHAVMPIMRIHLLRLQAQPYLSAEDRQNRLDEYSAITHAVLAGDAKAAERAMRRHLKQMQKRIARLPDDAFPTVKG